MTLSSLQFYLAAALAALFLPGTSLAQSCRASTSSAAPASTDLPAPGAGSWGTAYYAGGCSSGNAPYGAYDNKPLNNGDCTNLATDKAWDSIQLTKSDQLQIQLYDRVNCDISSGANCAVFNHNLDHYCVNHLGAIKGNFFARSIRIIQDGNVTLNKYCAVNPTSTQ